MLRFIEFNKDIIMFKWKVPQEVAAIKTPHKKLIEFLEKRIKL